jgi:hypothetical protein
MNFDQFEISIWQQHLLQSEINCMNNSLVFFFDKCNERIASKINGYQKLTEKIINFTRLIPALEESKEDFNEVLCLLLGGHYKACLLLLRTHFELKNGIIRAVKSDQNIDKFYEKRTKQGERKFLTKPFNIPDQWETELTTLYGHLSKFTHASGKSHSHKTFTPFPKPMFIKESFNYCLDLINQVIDHNSGLLKYCFNDKYWKKDLLKNLYGKEFSFKFDNTYADERIKFLLENIDNKVVNDILKGHKNGKSL